MNGFNAAFTSDVGASDAFAIYLFAFADFPTSALLAVETSMQENEDGFYYLDSRIDPTPEGVPRHRHREEEVSSLVQILVTSHMWPPIASPTRPGAVLIP
jgi:hypothetical protein